MLTDELDFSLPPELIAQEPAPVRSKSRLLHYRRSDERITHRVFEDLPQLLRKGDLLVFNDAKVIPARFTLLKQTGGRIEGLFIAEPRPGVWRVMLRNMGDPQPHVTLTFADATEVRAIVITRHDAEYELEVDAGAPALELLSKVGRMPLPPYIKRDRGHDARDELDRERYQTVFARQPTAVAAPTAALHFTPELLQQLDSVGVERAYVTLNVGIGTFKPVTAPTLDTHKIHSESYTIGPEAADALNKAKQQCRRIIAVGTTSARVLESQSEDVFKASSGETSIFIYPPYRWRHVDALITNFHLPRSTLIALVAALIGLDQQRRAYNEAITKRYRFFSYGDAMFID